MSGIAKRAPLPVVLRALLPVVLVAALTTLVVLVATLAASTGPTQVFEGVGPTPDRITTSTVTPTSEPTVAFEGESDITRLSGEQGESLLWVGPLVRGLLLALSVVALVLYLASVLRRRRVRRRGSDADVGSDADFAVVDPLAAVSRAVVEDAAEQDAALGEGSARNGIVEAWSRFEVQAGRGGVPRAEWETSTEFTERFLASVHADPEATARLGDLYRLARFSDHPLNEVDRAAAAAALARIRERARTSAQAP